LVDRGVTNSQVLSLTPFPSCGHFVDTLLWSNADPAFFQVSVLTFATHGRHKPRWHILSPSIAMMKVRSLVTAAKQTSWPCILQARFS